MSEHHTLTLTHKPLTPEEQQEYDAGDADTRAEFDLERSEWQVACPGYWTPERKTLRCSLWWECTKCRDEGLSDDDLDPQGFDEHERHGEHHERINDYWMTERGGCLTNLDSGHEVVTDMIREHGLGAGVHEFDIDDVDEDYVVVSYVKPEESA